MSVVTSEQGRVEREQWRGEAGPEAAGSVGVRVRARRVRAHDGVLKWRGRRAFCDVQRRFWSGKCMGMISGARQVYLT